jgi:hypothetical protein
MRAALEGTDILPSDAVLALEICSIDLKTAIKRNKLGSRLRQKCRGSFLTF